VVRHLSLSFPIAVALAILVMIIIIEFGPFTKQASSAPVPITFGISIDDLHRSIDMKALPFHANKEPF